MTFLDRPFVGSEALARGSVKKHQLRSHYRALFPGVYALKDAELTLRDRATAGWLWSHQQGVIAGLTASALHGARWVEDSRPIELVWSNARPARGLRTYDMRLRADEYGLLDGLPVTTPARTAFDVGRRGRLDDAIAHLDALGNATGFKAEHVYEIARTHRGVRGLRQLETALDLFDAGAASPKETWLRLLVIRAGFPRPSTQIPVLSPDRRRQYYLDWGHLPLAGEGWEALMFAVEYDGEQHRVDPIRYAYDIERSEDLAELGWTRVRVVKQNRPADVIRRLRRARESRLRVDRKIS